MLNNDDKITSFNVRSNRNTIVSFIGYQEHLVLRFIETFIDKDIDQFLLFTSKFNKDDDTTYREKNFEIRKKVTDFIKNKKNNEIPIYLFEIGNIWDFTEYYKALSSEKVLHAIINISAGPSVFSAACMVWAMVNGHEISYSIENRLNGKPISTIFNLIEIKSYLNSVFTTDNVDKMIIDTIKKINTYPLNTLDIHNYINNNLRFTLSLRTVEIHLNKLYKMGIVDIRRGKINIISFTDNWKKIESFSKIFLTKKSRL